MSDKPLLEWALSYASLGWPVFPCHPGQKSPMTEHGVKDASTDPDAIKAWWTRWPDANIGMACGPAASVVDIDKKDHVNGWESLKEFPAMPVTVVSRTPTGGAHFIFRADPPPRNKNSFRDGIDIRGEGYYIILPPSIHPNGLPYAWEDGKAPGEIELADFPDFMRPVRPLRPWEKGYKKPEEPKPAPEKPPERSQGTPIEERARLYLRECEAAVQGQAGHDKLLWAARALVVGFELSDSTALGLLWQEFNPRCSPPWDPNSPSEVKDFERKVTEVHRTPGEKPRGWLLDKYGLRVHDADAEKMAYGQRLADGILTGSVPQGVARHEGPEANVSTRNVGVEDAGPKQAIPQRQRSDLSDLHLGQLKAAIEAESGHRSGTQSYSVRSWGAIDKLNLPPQTYFWGRCFGLGHGAVRVHAIFGQGGLGKSRFILNLARNQVLGLPFAGLPTGERPLRHLIMGSENSVHRLQADIRKMQAGLSPEELEKLDKNIFLATLESPADAYVTLGDEGNKGRWRQTIEKIRPDVVYADPWGDVQSGDANSDTDTRATIAELAKILAEVNPNAALVIVAHSRTGAKNISEAIGFDGANFGKGSKALFSCSRAVFNLAPGDETEQPPVVVVCAKNNDAPRPAPFVLRQDPESMTFELVEGFDFEVWQAELHNRAACRKPAKRGHQRLTEEQAGEVLGDDTDTTMGLRSRLRCAGATRDEASDLVRKLIASGKWAQWTPQGKNQPTYIGPVIALKRRKGEWHQANQGELDA